MNFSVSGSLSIKIKQCPPDWYWEELSLHQMVKFSAGTQKNCGIWLSQLWGFAGQWAMHLISIDT